MIASSERRRRRGGTRTGPSTAALLAVGLLMAAGEAASGSEPPSGTAAAIREADAAIEALRDRLLLRLIEALERGGAAGAVRVCRDEAQRLTVEIANGRGTEVGRTSHRLRNPANAPRAWAREHVAAAADRSAEQAQPLVVDLGDRVGVLRPIPTGAMCLACHGAVGTLEPEVRRLLRTAYPEDRATGFAEGDLRGFFWAEAAKP